MTAKNGGSRLLDGFIKILVGCVACIYVFGIFWYQSINYAVIDIVLILGLGFRFSFVINHELNGWKFVTSSLFYILMILDQAYDVVNSSGSPDKILTSSSVILVALLVGALVVDCWQFIRTRSGLR